MDITQSIPVLRAHAEKRMNAEYSIPDGPQLTRLLVKHLEDVELRNALLTLMAFSCPKDQQRSIAYYIGAVCDLIELRKYAQAQPVGEDS